MEDIPTGTLVALLGFALGGLFGATAQRTNFCTMGAISDMVFLGDLNRFRAWMLAIAVAILGSQVLHLMDVVDLNESIYLSPALGWLGAILGGLMFGFGMTLSSGCGSKTLVRLGAGNLKSLVVAIVLGIFAYMTLRGLLALVRIDYVEVSNIDLTNAGLTTQGIDTGIATWFGLQNANLVKGIVAAVIGLGMMVFALKDSRFRKSLKNMLAGFSIGLFVVAGWYITGKIGFDEFEPVLLESYTFVAPVGDNLQYLMTYTGSTIKFGIAAVFGIIAGSFLYSILSGHFHFESFSSQQDMFNHIIGGALMGFGGVIALGCTIGQGVTGLSTLAIGSVITLAMIIFGSALTMKITYYMMDELGFLQALRSSLSDMKLFPAGKAG